MLPNIHQINKFCLQAEKYKKEREDMKLKKIVALTLAASMVMGMTGCAKKEAPAGDTAAPAGDAAAPAGDSASGEAGEVINLQLALTRRPPLMEKAQRKSRKRLRRQQTEESK